jgi:hypothetical protein
VETLVDNHVWYLKKSTGGDMNLFATFLGFLGFFKSREYGRI